MAVLHAGHALLFSEYARLNCKFAYRNNSAKEHAFALICEYNRVTPKMTDLLRVGHYALALQEAKKLSEALGVCVKQRSGLAPPLKLPPDQEQQDIEKGKERGKPIVLETLYKYREARGVNNIAYDAVTKPLQLYLSP